MANIGEPLRRVTVVPLTQPIVAPEGPQRSEPIKEPEAPVSVPEKEPVP